MQQPSAPPSKASRLRAAHHFALRHSLYPILLASALAMSTYVGRIVQSDSWVIYRNLVWNLFLAWIPYLFSLLADFLYLRQPRRWWRLGIPMGLWLIFFPNAPYLITDFLHLEQRAYVPIWYDILLITIFAWTGIFLAVASLRAIHRLVRHYAGRVMGWIFVCVAIALGGLGIYLGRFDRLNSWDLLLQPKSILADMVSRFADPLENIRFFGFTLLFTAFLFVCYWMFASPPKDEGEDPHPPS